MKRAIAKVQETASLTWMDWLIMRAIDKTSETWWSIEQMDLETLLTINEYYDIKDYIEEAQHKAEQQKQEAEARMSKFR